VNAIREFCEQRKITKTIESAFTSYCKTDYAQRFDLKEGDTIQRIITNMDEKQVLDAWGCFVSEFRDVLASM
jgi:hypothetical protein